MRPPILNALTPWGWVAAALLGLVFLVLTAGALGFRWDPFRLTERRLERTQADLAVARSDLSARRIEQATEVGQRNRLDAHHRQTTAVAALTAAAEADARKAPDAQQALDPNRTRRLHDLDRGLCQLAAGLQGCAAATGPAGRSDPPLSPGDPAGSADPGRSRGGLCGARRAGRVLRCGASPGGRDAECGAGGGG